MEGVYMSSISSAFKDMDAKVEVKRYGCAVIAAVIFAVNIKTFVRAGGLYPGGFNGLTLLIQGIFREFAGMEIPYTLINVALNAIPVLIGLKYIGIKFTLSSCVVIVLSSILTDLIPSQPITYDPLLISIFGGLINGFVVSLCLIGNTSSGGTDFIAIYFSEKNGQDICLIFLMIFFQSNTVPHLQSQKPGCFFTDHSSCISKFISFFCDTVSQCYILPEIFHVLRHIKITADTGFFSGGSDLCKLDVCKSLDFFVLF